MVHLFLLNSAAKNQLEKSKRNDGCSVCGAKRYAALMIRLTFLYGTGVGGRSALDDIVQRYSTYDLSSTKDRVTTMCMGVHCCDPSNRRISLYVVPSCRAALHIEMSANNNTDRFNSRCLSQIHRFML
jgi:hypothetical protein